MPGVSGGLAESTLVYFYALLLFLFAWLSFYSSVSYYLVTPWKWGNQIPRERNAAPGVPDDAAVSAARRRWVVRLRRFINSCLVRLRLRRFINSCLV